MWKDVPTGGVEIMAARCAFLSAFCLALLAYWGPSISVYRIAGAASNSMSASQSVGRHLDLDDVLGR